MPEVPYIADVGTAARRRVTHDLMGEIQSSIARDGFWQDEGEWRISTYMTRRVSVTENRGRRWFEVSVASGTEMTAHAPTLERALEFMFVFEQLVMDLFWTLGWDSWASRRELKPRDGDTLP